MTITYFGGIHQISSAPQIILSMQQPNPCRWSPRLKHPLIELSGLLAKRDETSRSCDAIVMGTLALKPGNTAPYKWSIVIVESDCWNVYIGIALEKVISKGGFRYKNLAERGMYFVSKLDGRGYVYDMSKVKKNGEKFMNQRLDLSYDPRTGVFRVENQISEWEFEVEQAPEGDCYRPFTTVWKTCQVRLM